jgi:DNA (cytosine-5)-methyltransferase 1
LLALDLFCGAGGASMGLHRAGFDVTGVDINPQPRYPFKFIQADAMTFPLEGHEFIWASPPCQAFTDLKSTWNAKAHPDLLTPTRQRLLVSGLPYVIENVEGAPMFHPLVILCGTMFGLRTADGTAELRRHRVFEHSFPMPLIPYCEHSRFIPVIGVYGGHGHDRRRKANMQNFSVQARREAMGISWMTGTELSQAVPPAYAEFIGKEAIIAIQEARGVPCPAIRY